MEARRHFEEGSMANREEYLRKLHESLERWNGEIDRLAVQAALAKAEARDEIEGRLAELRRTRDAATARLEELKAAGDDAWEDLKSGAELAWSALGDALDSARKRFGG
jgi:multidrug resistance efflux pump